MEENQRQRVGALTAFVDEVKPDAVDGGPVMRQAVEFGFLFPPVELMLPEVDKALQVVEVGAVLPACSGHGIGPARTGQSVPKVIQDGLGQLNPEGFGGIRKLGWLGFGCHELVSIQ